MRRIGLACAFASALGCGGRSDRPDGVTTGGSTPGGTTSAGASSGGTGPGGTSSGGTSQGGSAEFRRLLRQ